MTAADRSGSEGAIRARVPQFVIQNAEICGFGYESILDLSEKRLSRTGGNRAPGVSIYGAGGHSTSSIVEQLIASAVFDESEVATVFAASELSMTEEFPSIESLPVTKWATTADSMDAAFRNLEEKQCDVAIVVELAGSGWSALSLRRYEQSPPVKPLAVINGCLSPSHVLDEVLENEQVQLLVINCRSEAGSTFSARKRTLPFCLCSDAGGDVSFGDSPFLLDVIFAACALHHKILPSSRMRPTPGRSTRQGSIFYESERPRPWIMPVSPLERWVPRAALVVCHGHSGVDVPAALVLEEFDQGQSTGHRIFFERPSEMFVFARETALDLEEEIAWIRSECARGTCDVHQLSEVVNLDRSKAGKFRAAIVARDIAELDSKLSELQEHLSTAPEVPWTYNTHSSQGCFYNAGLESGRTAFVLPGLGAAYPDMLVDLSLHFPACRQVFDYVDRLAIQARDPLVPSRLIFPVEGENPWGRSSPAVLATADSAVVLVLLAEYAIFTLLRELGVEPDDLIGCSTGEFACLTMSGCVEILEAAELFYKLSTAVSRSVGQEQLKDLRTIAVHAPWKEIEPLVCGLPEPVYLGAELTDKNLLLSGSAEAVSQLQLRLKQTPFRNFLLPTAIPYHTPLVADKVSYEHNEVQQLNMKIPVTPMWSCSLGDLYPGEIESVRHISTELFEHPILLRQTVERAYESGVRTFCEIGPRGNLQPFIDEILQGKPHNTVPANVPGGSSVTQFQLLLSWIFVCGQELKLDYLYRNSTSRFRLRHNFADECPADGKESVMLSFLQSAKSLQHTFFETQKQAMLAFLDSSQPVSRDGPEDPNLYSSCDLTDLLSCVSELAIDELPAGARLVIVGESIRDFSIDEIAAVILSSSESGVFEKLRQKDQGRMRSYVLGRLAAKVAVVSSEGFACVTPEFLRSVEVFNDISGRPFVQFDHRRTAVPAISISHSAGVAAALSFYSNESLQAGVDIEQIRVREDGFARLAFSQSEVAVLNRLISAGHQREFVETLIWSAKEAAAKSCGRGTAAGSGVLRVAAIDMEKSEVLLLVDEQLSCLVHTFDLGDYVAACCFLRSMEPSAALS